jgi:hypothetical protein
MLFPLTCRQFDEGIHEVYLYMRRIGSLLAPLEQAPFQIDTKRAEHD